ncbi:hypothetical protein MIM_c10600 [Advenella mimigardefordensis DPN7]|uniref:Uncharacterized protein n=1 Tax=Advenella mimigardefordensis (strain DSM 17166 / LMG 22922 / DPN7) TaxID=1247726 RepID=W0PDP4_ADVMD|nr:hypothetical protein MIM_c10600 [Advenella mimigardefordensis DPN7]
MGRQYGSEYKHFSDKEKAEWEADFLAKRNPEEAFVIYECIQVSKVELPVKTIKKN